MQRSLIILVVATALVVTSYGDVVHKENDDTGLVMKEGAIEVPEDPHSIFDLQRKKRSPKFSGGKNFFGMRGKRKFDDDLQDDDFLEKRAPKPDKMSFYGMRGKRPSHVTDMANSLFAIRGRSGEKPRRSNFFGMRGKRYPVDYSAVTLNQVKRKEENRLLQMLRDEFPEHSAQNAGDLMSLIGDHTSRL